MNLKRFAFWGLTSAFLFFMASGCSDDAADPSPDNAPIEEFITWEMAGKSPVTVYGTGFTKRDFQYLGTDSSLYIHFGDVSGMPSNLLHLFYDTDPYFGYALHEGEYVPDWAPGNAELDPDSITTFGLQTMGQWSGKISFWADRDNPFTHFKIYKHNGQFVIDFKEVTLINDEYKVEGTLSGLIVWDGE